MRIAILSDIHGNGTALKAVLEEAKGHGVEELFILGDTVGYYYDIVEILQMLSSWKTVIIKGNHEGMLERAHKEPAYLPELTEWLGHSYALALWNLEENQLYHLFGLPQERYEEREGIRFALFHGAPWDPIRYLYPDGKEDLFDRCGEVDADVVLLGHTHRPLISIRGEKLILNPGSVGQARNRGGVAHWMLYDTDNRVVTPQETPYDIGLVLEQIKRNDPENVLLRDALFKTPRREPL